MKQKEPWTFPDGTQLSRTALEAMGLSPTNTRQFMLQLYQNRSTAMMQNPGEKLSATIRDREIDADNAEGQQRDEERRQEQEQRREAAHDEAVRQNDARAYQQMTYDEKKEFEEKLAEKRAADERANANILGGMGGLMSWGLGLGLTGAALSGVSQMAGPSLSSLAGPMMLASNNRGGLLADLRGAMGIEQKPDQDILLKGPGQTAKFTPGTPEAMPEPDAPGLSLQQRRPGIGMGPAAPSPFGMN